MVGYYQKDDIIELKDGADSLIREQITMSQGSVGIINQVDFIKSAERFGSLANSLSFLLLLAGTVWYIVEIYRHQTSFNIYVAATYLIVWIYSILSFVRKRNMFGSVVEQYSRLPIPLALVRVFASETHKLKRTIVSDDNGKIALVLTRNRYDIYCAKYGYEQTGLKKFDVDERFSSLDLEMKMIKSQEQNASY